LPSLYKIYVPYPFFFTSFLLCFFVFLLPLLFPTRRSSDLSTPQFLHNSIVNILLVDGTLYSDHYIFRDNLSDIKYHIYTMLHYRSEERRVGKECRSRWSADH